MSQALRQAAVLIPLSRDADATLRLTLIERSSNLANHPGQLAFPGGTYDPGRDSDLLATALREAEEEIGLPGPAVTVLGALVERRTYTSRFRILPFVGRIEPRQVMTADPREVASVLTVPLCQFQEQPRPRIQPTRAGLSFELPCVHVGPHLVWGATLDIIDDLLASPLLDLV